MAKRVAKPATELAAFFRLGTISKFEFARRCKLSAPYLSQLISGVRGASFAKAQTISDQARKCGGSVSVASLMLSEATRERRRQYEARSGA